MNPSASVLHIWTDSPTSQYRNKTIFNAISQSPDVLNFFIWWNYYESGHGKSVCDAIGGTAKRVTDIAVRQGKCIVQNVNDFFAFHQQHSEISLINYFFLHENDKVSTFHFS